MSRIRRICFALECPPPLDLLDELEFATHSTRQSPGDTNKTFSGLRSVCVTFLKIKQTILLILILKERTLMNL